MIASLRFLSFLDDLSIVLPPEAVSTAMPIVEEELAAVGLSANRDKSLCWAPSGQQPPGEVAEGLWNNASRHDGMVLCGCPFEGVISHDEDDFDIDLAVPIGGPDFTDTFLAKYRTKIAALVDRITEIPSTCSPERLAVQSANLLLRYCCAHKATGRRCVGHRLCRNCRVTISQRSCNSTSRVNFW